jgi:hypothetical protein
MRPGTARRASLALGLCVAACGRWGYDAPGAIGDAGLPAEDADGGTQGGDDADLPVGGPGCGSLQLLAESFDDASTRQYWYTVSSGGGQAQLANDRVELRLGAGGNPTAEAGYESNSSFDLRHSEISVEVLRVGGQRAGLALRDGPGRDRFNAFIGASRGVALAVQDDELVALTLDGNDVTPRASTGYDADADRYFRLREADGVVYWETSPDRIDWSTFHEEAAPLDASLVYPQLFVRGQAGSASEAWFDELNVPAAPVPGYCAAADLRDDFEADAFAPAWRPWNGAGTCTVTQEGGRAALSFPGSFSACSLVSVARFDLRASSFAVELAAVPAANGFQTLFELRTARIGDRVELRLAGTSATFSVFANGNKLSESSIGYDPGLVRHVRLRAAGGQLAFETSADGDSWATPITSSAPIDLSAVTLAVTGLQTGNTPQTLRLESVNGP